ncbi:MAG: hypothetical protein IPO07_28245 [Haliscomenobacter sp.]|nr:hypothetical protein [Haliscomenobacter sp.]MBK9492246.1 hypothetical protein [Haliscomenobacter sp.]
MATIQTVTVKAADPGLGFSLNLDDNGAPINQTLKVIVKVTDSQNQTFTSTVIVNDPISDKTINFVVPFGDNQYTPGETLNYSLDIYIPFDAPTPVNQPGVVIANSGKFELLSDAPSSIPDGGSLGPGQLMNSIKGNQLGIMQLDGNFCVYDQFAKGKNSRVKNTDSTYSQGNGNNCSLQVRGGRIFIHNNSTNKDVSASPANQAMPGAAMVISKGLICLQLPGNQPQQVQVRPGNV